MGLLVFHARRQALLQQNNFVQYEITRLTQKIMDLQRYAANISDGGISMQEVGDIPGNLFDRQLAFLGNAHNQSLFNADKKMADPMLQSMLQTQTQNAIQSGQVDAAQQAQYQQMYAQALRTQIYQEERQRLAKQETKLLNEQEKRITQQKQTLETQQKMLDQELEALKQAEGREIQRFKPEYVGG